MASICLSLLRGVCQIPAYVAYEKGFFREADVDAEIQIEPTAWVVPEKLVRGSVQFAVMPWTRVAAAQAKGEPLILVCGSGMEEAALVVRKGLTIDQVKTVAVPQRGGIKDLTAAGLVESLGWSEVEFIRLPSGDGAILSLVGEGADAASMVEPYASMMEALGIGTVVKRTGDIWPKAPGCSLTTTSAMIETNPDLVSRVVASFVRGSQFIRQAPDECASIAARYIGVNEKFIRRALTHNLPDPNALRSTDAMDRIIGLMLKMGYIKERPDGYVDMRFLDKVAADPQG